MATRVAPPRRRCVEFFIAGGIFDAHLRSISARTELHAQRNLAPLRLRRQTPARHNPLFDLHEIGRQPRDSPARRGPQSGQGLQRGPRLSTSPLRRSSRCPLCRHDENSVSPQTISQPAPGLKDAVRRCRTEDVRDTTGVSARKRLVRVGPKQHLEVDNRIKQFLARGRTKERC